MSRSKTLPDTFWRKSSKPNRMDRKEITTDKGNTVELDMETEIRPKYNSDLQPAECNGIYFRKEGGSYVLITSWVYTGKAVEQLQGKHRKIEGFNIDYSVFQQGENP